MGQPIPLQFGPDSNFGKFGLDGSKRVFNAYAVPLGNDGKAPFALYAAPGLRPFASVPTKGLRGGIVVNGTAYVVIGRVLYSVSQLGDVTEIGGIPGDDFVAAAANALADPHIQFCASGRIYMMHSGVFSELQTDALPPVVDIDFIRGRFVYGIADGRWFYSDINSTEIGGASYYNAEGKPDGLTAVWVRRNEVWLLGTQSVEIYTPTENVDDPFTPLGGGALPYGCVSAASVAQNNDSIFWVDQSHIVRRTSGYEPSEISPPWLTRLIEKEVSPSRLIGSVYALDGQQYYELSGTEFTARYSLSANVWTERDTLGMKRWRGQGALEFGGKTLVGDVATGDLYELDKDYPYDGSSKIMVRLRSPIISANPQPISIYSLHADMISGADDDGSDPELGNPVVMLRMSDDGKSFTDPLKEPLWKQGETGRVIWRQLGTYERQGAVAEISYWAGVGKAMMGAVINGAAGST